MLQSSIDFLPIRHLLATNGNNVFRLFSKENSFVSDPGSSKDKPPEQSQGLKDQRSWSLRECVDVFSESCRNLSSQLKVSVTL